MHQAHEKRILGEIVPDVVVVDHLSHHDGAGPLRRQVLADVSFRVAAGEVVILSGPRQAEQSTVRSCARSRPRPGCCSSTSRRRRSTIGAGGR